MSDQKTNILEQTVVEAEVLQPKRSLAEKLKAEKTAKKKKFRKRAIRLSLLAFFSLLVWFLIKPFKASEIYGVCHTLLELTIPYPHTMYVSEVQPTVKRGLVMWYSHIDAFGEYRLEEFTCNIGYLPSTDGVSPPKLSVINLEKRKQKFDQETIESFNHAMIYFEENPLVFNYPAALPDTIGALHFDFASVVRYRVDNISRN